MKRRIAKLAGLLLALSMILTGIPVTQAEAASKLSGYDSINGFSHGLAMVTKNGKYGFIDKNGKVVVKLNYEDAYSFSDGLAAVKKNGKWGFVDTTGKLVIKAKYDSAYSFSDGLARVETTDGNENWKTSYIDKKGKTVVKLKKGESGGMYSDGVIVVRKANDTYSILDKKGTVLVKNLKYMYVSDFSDGLAAVCENGENGKWGYINQKGKVVIKPSYLSGATFSGGLARVTKDEETWYYINKKGKVVAESESVFGSGFSFSDGLGIVNQKDGRGFIDKTGKKVFSLKDDNYFWISDFSDGMAAVSNQKWQYGYINKKGKEVIKCQYDSGGDFSEGIAVVSKNGKYYFIDKTGKVILK